LTVNKYCTKEKSYLRNHKINFEEKDVKKKYCFTIILSSEAQ